MATVKMPTCFDEVLLFLKEFEAPLGLWELGVANSFPSVERLRRFTYTMSYTERHDCWLTKHHSQKQADLLKKRINSLKRTIDRANRLEVRRKLCSNQPNPSPFDLEILDGILARQALHRRIIQERFFKLHGTMGAICETFDWPFLPNETEQVASDSSEINLSHIQTTDVVGDYEHRRSELEQKFLAEYLPVELQLKGRRKREYARTVGVPEAEIDAFLQALLRKGVFKVKGKGGRPTGAKTRKK